MNSLLAHYVLALSKSSEQTRIAEDRPIYQRLLADAAVLLALAETGAAPKIIRERLENHDRIWGSAWLQDPSHEPASSAWEAVKEQIGK